LKVRLWFLLLTSFLIPRVCFSQIPKPALLSSSSNEVSADFLMPVKGESFAHSGTGGQIADSHFFGEHFGIKLQADYERTNWLKFQDSGLRTGPIIRFATKRAVQPYVEALVGYARVKATYLKPVNSFHGSGSALVGGGFDYRLAGGWYAKIGVDFQGDWASSTRVQRGLIGISYRRGNGVNSRY